MAFLVCSAILGHAAPVAAETVRPWRLVYTKSANAPANCPDEDYIRAALDAKLSTSGRITADAPRSISIKVLRSTKQVEAHIEARDEDGKVVAEQIVHAPSWRCDQLGDRAVFAVRDIVAPLELPPLEETAPQAPEEPPAREHPTPPPPPPPITAPVNLPPVEAPPHSSRIAKLALSGGVGTSWWSAPQTALSIAIGVQARWPRVSLGIEGHYDRAWSLPDLPDLQSSRVDLAMLACASSGLWRNRVFARGCVLGQFGRLSAEAGRVNLPNQDATAIDVGARLGGGVWLAHSFGVELGVDGAFVAHRPAFVINGRQVWRMPPFVGALRFSVVGLFDVF